MFTRDGSGVWSQQAYIKASNTDTAGGSFGSLSIAIDGNTLAVAAAFENSLATGVDGDQTDSSAPGAGAVYVFTRDGSGVWSQQAYIKASNTDEGDNFGSLLDLDGDTLAVGADGEDSNATGVNGDQDDNIASGAGAVYVFTRDGNGVWSQQAYLKASNTDSGDHFGGSLALAGDTLAVGAIDEQSSATGVDGNQAHNSNQANGAVYVFTRDGNDVWSQQAYIKASNTEAFDPMPLALDKFAIRLALDGDTLAVAATGESSGVNGDQSDNSAPGAGAIYVFTRDGSGVWSQQAYIKASNVEQVDVFGFSVALDGDTLAVGAFGEDSNARGIDGNQASNSDPNSGAVYVFD